MDKAAELVVLPERMAVPLPCPDLPEIVLAAIAAVQVRLADVHTRETVWSCLFWRDNPCNLGILHATCWCEAAMACAHVNAVPMDSMALGRGPLQCTVVEEAAHVAVSGRVQAHASAATLDSMAVWEDVLRT